MWKLIWHWYVYQDFNYQELALGPNPRYFFLNIWVYPGLLEALLDHHDLIESYHSSAMKAWATSCSDSLIDFTNRPRSKISHIFLSLDSPIFYIHKARYIARCLISTIFQEGKTLKSIDQFQWFFNQFHIFEKLQFTILFPRNLFKIVVPKN